MFLREAWTEIAKSSYGSDMRSTPEQSEDE